jgi:hypothetical protein
MGGVRDGLRVLATHDHGQWNMGLLFLGAGQKRPDARSGAVWRAVPVEEGFFVIDDECYCGIVLCVLRE